ncbi:MAG: Transcription regulator [contains diacylglycerol kinase catalytic domain], partial [uncultured Solirubrobacteraceae bacterium]
GHQRAGLPRQRQLGSLPGPAAGPRTVAGALRPRPPGGARSGPGHTPARAGLPQAVDRIGRRAARGAHTHPLRRQQPAAARAARPGRHRRAGSTVAMVGLVLRGALGQLGAAGGV